METIINRARFISERPLVQGFSYHDPDFYPPIVNATRLLCRAGFSVELFTRETGGDHVVNYPPEARVVRLEPGRGGSWARFLRFLRESTRRSQANAAFFWGHDMHGFLAARLAAWRRRRPLVYHCHDYADPGWMTMGIRMVHAFERRFARTADTVVIPDAGRAEVISRDLRLRRAPLIAANAPILTPLPERRALREALAERGHQFDRIVFRQGRVGRGHGIEATLRSLPAWQERGWGFVVMGIFDSDAYVESLHRLARELEVADRFVVLPPVPYDRIMDYTRDADVGHALYERIHVNNVHIGTASNKVMEYLACGVPLLVSPNKKLQSLVESSNCGVFADEQNPASIARGVNLLLSDEGRRIGMGQAARRAFEAEYCYDRQFAPVLDRMCALAAQA